MSDASAPSAPAAAPASAPTAAPPAESEGITPVSGKSGDRVFDFGKKSESGKRIDSGAEQTLAEKIIHGASDEPAAKEPEAPEPKGAPVAEALPPKPKAEAKPPPPAPTKYKVKIDGKEEEVTLAELQRDYQVRKVADKRLQEAADLKKKVEGVLNVLRDDPLAALKAAGLTDEQVEAVAIQHIAKKQQEYIEQEQLKSATPEQKELADLRKRAKEAEEYRQQVETQKRQYVQQQAEQQITSLVISTLEELPVEYRRNDFVASRALDAWQYAWENQQMLRDRGVELSPQTVARSLKREIEGLGMTLKQLQAAADGGATPTPPAPKPGAEPVSRNQEKVKEKERQGERLTTAQLMRKITLGER